MSIKITLIVLTLLGILGASLHEPICSEDDRRYTEMYGIDEECVDE